jgi:hypothetical protein
LHLETVGKWLSGLGWRMKTNGRIRFLRIYFIKDLRAFVQGGIQDRRQEKPNRSDDEQNSCQRSRDWPKVALRSRNRIERR